MAAIAYQQQFGFLRTRISSSVIARVAVPIIVADFALLPMFHIGGVPWKPGYVILGIASLFYLRTFPRSHLLAVRPFFILAIILMIGTALGSFVFEFKTLVGPSTATLRMMVVYALIPMAILVGVGDRRDDDRWILWIIIAFFTINVFVTGASSHLDRMMEGFTTEGFVSLVI